MYRTANRLSLTTILTVVLLIASLGVWYRIALSAVTTPPFFSNYTTWNHAQSGVNVPPYWNLVTSAYSKTQPYTFADINGDNLPDFLYMVVPTVTLNNPQFYAVFLNNGSNNLNLAFKCVFIPRSGNPDFYGDCAAGAPARDPNAPANQNMLANVKSLLTFQPDSTQFTLPDTLWLDFNGDGLLDFVKDNNIFTNRGNDFNNI